MHSKDEKLLKAANLYANLFDGIGPIKIPTVDYYFDQIDIQDHVADFSIKVLFTPGHAPGHVVFYNKENKFVINGDVLFNGSFGRVDLPGGDLDLLKSSIFEIMFELPDETVVYCGHGPETTIEKEKSTNYIHQF